ncbi:MAG TPA: OsmC family protein [Acidobacteriaceae bacterium]|nr:OsmC family protein [Acidobacteriaceae bacterium]
MIEVTVDHLGSVQFEIHARQHTLVCDQPPANGGFDEGMTPPEIFLGGLGACAAYYAAEYLRKHGLATEGTRVRVEADKLANPARLDHLRIEVDLPLTLNAEHGEGVERAVRHCLIHNTLLSHPIIEIAIQVPAEV